MEGRLIDDAGVLREGLGPLPEAMAHPTLIAVSGLPGTGKSYLCRRLLQRLQAVRLESDQMRRRLFQVPSYTPEESGRLFRALNCLIYELLRRGISVVLDATNLEERHREQLYRLADQARARLIMIRMYAPEDVIRRRLEQRARGIDQADHSEAGWDVYCRLRATEEKIRRSHITVDSSKDIGPAIEKIVRLANRQQGPTRRVECVSVAPPGACE